MKILKEGKNLDIMRVTCMHCNAELEITSKDVEVRVTNIMHKCPCCQKANYLNLTTLTEDFKFYLGILSIGKDGIINRM